MRATRAVELAKRDRATELLGLLRIRHLGHLVCDRFDPGLAGFDFGDHGCNLASDDWLLNERLAKDDALVAPFEAFLENGAGPAGDHSAHHEAFVVAGFILVLVVKHKQREL